MPTKALARGMFTRNGPSKNEGIKVCTLQVWWSDCEASAGVFNFSKIRAAVESAKAAGYRAVRLRPMHGVNAPEWLKDLVGKAVYYEPHDKKSATLARLWDPTYQAYAERFDHRLALEFDDDPFVTTVFVSGGMTYYAESCIRGGSDPSTRATLVGLGYTYAADQALLHAQVDWMRGWRKTWVAMSFNPLQRVDGASWTQAQAQAGMAELMDYLLAVFPDRAVLQNNSIREDYIAKSPKAFYDEFRKRSGVPHQFQVAQVALLGDEAKTIRWAIDSLGASGIEFGTTLSATQYAAFDAEMNA